MLSCLAVCAPVRGEVSESQRLLDDLLGNLIELLPVIAPHFGRIHVSSTFVIGLCQHAHHRQQDLLHALHRTPPLRTALVAHGVVAWRVEDGNADSPIRVDVGMKHLTGKSHLWGDLTGNQVGNSGWQEKRQTQSRCLLGP